MNIVSPPKCPICLLGNQFKFIQDYNSSDGNFSLYECLNCKVQFWTPLKNPGAEWYQKQIVYSDRAYVSEGLKIWHEKFFKTTNSLEGLNILDIGCGTGEFLLECKKRGAEGLWGIDFDERAINQASKENGLNVFCADIVELQKEKNLPKFDLVTMFEVVEHLDNPRALIQNLKNIIKNGGILVISTPSRERFFVNTSWDFPYHHLTRWNEKSISNFLRKYDFNVFSISYNSQFNYISSFFQEKFSFGIVRREVEVSSQVPKSSRSKIIFLRRLAWVKNLLTVGIPSFVVFGWGKLIGRKNGDMLVKAKYEAGNI